MSASALILAGGKATRYGGRAKHLIEIDGETIFARQVRVLSPRVTEILVSAPKAHAGFAGYRAVHDAPAFAGAGPLAGVSAGLAACATPWLVVLAGDMPNVTGELLDELLALRRADLDAVGVRSRGAPQPLLCALHVRIRAALDGRLANGSFKASALLTDAGLRVAWLDDPDVRTLVNINSPGDLRES